MLVIVSRVADQCINLASLPESEYWTFGNVVVLVKITLVDGTYRFSEHPVRLPRWIGLSDAQQHKVADIPKGPVGRLESIRRDSRPGTGNEAPRRYAGH